MTYTERGHDIAALRAPLGIDALIRSMGLNSPCRHMLLLGAGASVTSGIPTANGCIWRWKWEIFLSGQASPSSLVIGDPSLPHVRQQIQAWLDATGGFPPLDADEEYSFYAEHCYPVTRDRRKFFEHLISRGNPALGYQALATLIDLGHFRWIWTTNFDDLLERARPSSSHRLVRQVGMDSTTRLHQVEPDDTALVHVMMHGDYRYDSLRNTQPELRLLDEVIREQLQAETCRYPLVVVGYSGRDDSVMGALEAAYTRPGDGGLYWLELRGVPVHPRVRTLMERAQAHGRHAELIEFDGFDAFMLGLARYLLRDSEAAGRVDALARSRSPQRSPFVLKGYRGTEEIIKSNSWPVEVPDLLHQFSAKNIDSWKALREKLAESNRPICAGLLKRHVIAMGTRDDLLQTFDLDGPLEQIEIAPRDLFWDDSVVLGILKKGLAQALASSPLLAAGESRQWFIYDSTQPVVTTWHGRSIRHFKAVEVRLEQRAGKLFLSLIPDRYVRPEDWPTGLSDADWGPFKTNLVSRQWNTVFNQELNEWRKRLGLEVQKTVTFPPAAEVGFRYRIDAGPVFTQVVRRREGRDISPRGKSSLYRFKAFELPEPPLRFHRGTDIHPIRGIVQCGPVELDLALARQSDVRLGVVCPGRDATRVAHFLRSLSDAHPMVESKKEYLLPYPGFERAFRIPLRVPSFGEEAWVAIDDKLDQRDAFSAGQDLLLRICGAIDRLAASGRTDVVLVYVPAAWADVEHIEAGPTVLDLHDQIKAFAAARGIRTQLLREATLGKQHQAEVRWWLALAVYAKSLRTPWILARPEEDVAFVGVGYSVDRGNKDAPIVLGCSHIYQSAGVGLRFQLARIQNPIWRHRSPYLSRDDALQLGIQTRQSFFESLGRLPKRVLVSKRTPFISEELDGLRSGLAGVGSIDFLTIEEEHAWRFVAWEHRRQEVARFPVRRGTGVLLDEETFLLWVHGRVEGFGDGGPSYYQGKSRIPRPIRVRRFGGDTAIEQIGFDLLGLSKMDWNSFDLYHQMPAHVSTPNTIARVGQLLKRFSPESFDYRLFM